MGRRNSVHRLFYPNARPGEDSREVKPAVKADPVVDSQGVHLNFTQPERAWTPDELQMLARWLYSLSHEAKEVAVGGLITETTGYDVQSGKVVPRTVDT